MFEVFRRRRKGWLAALTILAMVAFAFPVSNFLDDSGPTDRERVEVVDTMFGRPITSEDVRRARFERELANAFVFHSLVAVGARIPPEYQNIVDMERGFGPSWDDDDIKDAIRRAHKADQFGIKISDDAVRDFIKQLTGDRLSGEQFRGVLKTISARFGGEIRDEFLFDILRGQLRIRRASHLALGGGRGGAAQVTPYEAWQFYRELNDRLAIEAIAVPVAEFAERVNDPGDEALRELYSQYITRLPEPMSPDPGFKEPRKVHLQYATVNLADFALAWKPETEISDEEVKNYYESNKPLYRVIAAPTPPPPSEIPEKPEPDSPKPPDDATPKDPAAPPEDKKPNQPKSDDPPADPDPKKESDSNCTSQDPPADDPKPTPDSADSKPAPAAQQGDDTKPQDSSKPTSPVTPAPSDTEPKGDEPQYRPLEEVAEEIRDVLQKEKARAELLKRLDRVGRTVNDYGVKVYVPAKDRHETAKETNPDAVFEPPATPDFAAASEDLGLKFVDTGAIALLEELPKLEGLGTAMELSGGRTFGRDVSDVMQTTDLFEAIEFRNSQDDYFVAWKVADMPETEPPFQAIRDKVLAAYRHIKARELAREQANQLAKSIRDAGADLEKFREKHPDVATVTIGPLTLWNNAPAFSMNAVGRPGPIRPSDLPGVNFATEEMRESLFQLKQSEVAVTVNEPQDTYYVMLLTERETASRDEFARARPLIEEQLRSRHDQELFLQWRKGLRAESAGTKRTSPAGN